MSKTWLGLIIVLISLSLGSCGAPPAQEKTETPTPPPTEQTQPEAQPEPETETEIKTNPRVAISGLIPPTNPETRVRGVVKGVDNPFASLAPTPKITITQDQNLGSIPEPPPEQVSPEQASPEQVSPTTETEPNLELARAVVVNGIVTLGDTVQIILKAPKEDFSRYVEVGQYISNGEVLVKRIEEGDNRTVFVVLEQSGIEVRKPVGTTDANQPDTPAASS